MDWYRPEWYGKSMTGGSIIYNSGNAGSKSVQIGCGIFLYRLTQMTHDTNLIHAGFEIQ